MVVPTVQGRQRNAPARAPLRIRSTPLMGKEALLSPFGVSTHPLDRNVAVSGRMALSESHLLGKSNALGHSINPESPGQVKENGDQERSVPQDSTPLPIAPDGSASGGCDSLYLTAHQEELRLRSCEVVTRLSKEHSIDCSQLTEQFPFGKTDRSWTANHRCRWTQLTALGTREWNARPDL